MHDDHFYDDVMDVMKLFCYDLRCGTPRVVPRSRESSEAFGRPGESFGACQALQHFAKKKGGLKKFGDGIYFQMIY